MVVQSHCVGKKMNNFDPVMVVSSWVPHGGLQHISQWSFFSYSYFFWIFLFYIFVVHILSILIFKKFWIVYSYIVVLDFFSCLCFLISSLLCFFFYAHCWFYGLSNLAYKWECSLYRLKKINKNIKVLN